MPIYHASVVLFSGGLDSTTVLAKALISSERTYALSFSYGQRHSVELEAAKAISSKYMQDGYNLKHYIQQIDLRIWGGSSLTSDAPVPNHGSIEDMPQGVPSTYVPGRNTVFLSFALSLAQAVGAEAVWTGVNALDYSGYPDCRPEFIAAMQNVYDLAGADLSNAVDIKIEAPLIHMTKVQIIQEALAFNAPIDKSWSCYDPQTRLGIPAACGKCDSCLIRKKGFEEAQGVGYAVAR